MTRALKFLGYVLVAVYFVADVVFGTVARPLSAWIGRLQILRAVNAWIESLRPYPALALFSVPLVVLEPVKPVGAFLVSAGHVTEGTLTIVLGEILKITLVERLFRLTRDRLMQIPIFAVLYNHWIRIHDWITSLNIWQWMRGQKEWLKLMVIRTIVSIRRPQAHDLLRSRNERSAPVRRLLRKHSRRPAAPASSLSSPLAEEQNSFVESVGRAPSTFRHFVKTGDVVSGTKSASS